MSIHLLLLKRSLVWHCWYVFYVVQMLTICLWLGWCSCLRLPSDISTNFQNKFVIIIMEFLIRWRCVCRHYSIAVYIQQKARVLLYKIDKIYFTPKWPSFLLNGLVEAISVPGIKPSSMFIECMYWLLLVTNFLARIVTKILVFHDRQFFTFHDLSFNFDDTSFWDLLQWHLSSDPSTFQRDLK